MNNSSTWIKTTGLFCGLLALTLLLACQEAPKVSPSAKVTPPLTTTTDPGLVQYQDLVLLQEPAKDGGYKSTLLAKTEEGYQLMFKDIGAGLCEQLAIGEYPIELVDGQLAAHYPNDFYRSKLPNSNSVECIIDSTELVGHSLYDFFNQSPKVRTLVLPSILFDGDREQRYSLTPCQACPHWKSEQYSRLTLELNRIFSR